MQLVFKSNETYIICKVWSQSGTNFQFQFQDAKKGRLEIPIWLSHTTKNTLFSSESQDTNPKESNLKPIQRAF